MRPFRTLAAAVALIALSPVAGTSASAIPGEIPSADDLIDKYNQALDAVQSYIASFEEICEYSYNVPQLGPPLLNAKRFTRGKHRADGQRVYHQSYHWGDFNQSLRNLPEDTPGYNLRIERDGVLYVHAMAVNDPQSKGSIGYQPSQAEKAVISRHPYSGLLGFRETDERLDAVLRQARPPRRPPGDGNHQRLSLLWNRGRYEMGPLFRLDRPRSWLPRGPDRPPGHRRAENR